MAEPVEFHVHRAWVLLSKVGGVAALAVSGLAFASPSLDAEVSPWLAAGIGTFALAAAASSFRAGFQPRSYSVQMSDEGVLVPWRDVATVELDLRQTGGGNRLLDVFLVRTSGVREPIKPTGANPFDLKARLAARLAKERATGWTTAA